MSQLEWYGAKTVYKHLSKDDENSFLFEERVVVVRATNFDHAIEEGEKEANEYASSLDNVTYLGYMNVYKLVDDTIENKTEVYSLMRKSNLDDDGYLNSFYDTGDECTR